MSSDHSFDDREKQHLQNQIEGLKSAMEAKEDKFVNLVEEN
jgi:hypothetical protein